MGGRGSPPSAVRFNLHKRLRRSVVALDMTPEQKAVGKENFQRVVGKLADGSHAEGQGVTRRRFMQGLVAAGAVAPLSAAAYYG